jgi:hypothetical protein
MLPVNDPLGMCCIKSVRNLDAEIEHLLYLQGLPRDPMPERLTFQQFHCDECSPVKLF